MIEDLPTEQRNPASEQIDAVSTTEMLEIINGQDRLVSQAVGAEISSIAEAVDAIAERFRRGGRLFYAGAGTSGRLGVLDAAELPPTFGLEEGRVIALIAGGRDALVQSIEGAEDDDGGAVDELKHHGLNEDDALIGVAASGRTPYVLGAMRFAREKGAWTGAVTTNPDSMIAELADVSIAPVVGPEVIAGSTRMKSGTAQKLVLNMISTGLMIRLGSVLGNLMVNVQLKNDKLWDRAERIVSELADVERAEARSALKEAGDVRTAVLMKAADMSVEGAVKLLADHGGVLRNALEAAASEA